MQVLQEFFVTVTRKMRAPLSPAAALKVVKEYLNWHVVENTGDLLVAFVELQKRHKFSFWDALVVQAALSDWV